MSHSSKKSSGLNRSRLVARLIGMLLMAGIVVILGFVGLKFIEGMDKKTPTPEAEKVVAKQGSAEQKPERKKARYDFYHELSGRRAEVEKEVEQKIGSSAKVPDVKGSNYRIQVGAFREKEQANRMRARMILRDYPVTIIRNGSFYLVQIGPYKEKDQAQRVENQLKREGVDTLLKAYVNN